MSDDNRYLIVGGFVIAVIVALVALILGLADDASSKRLERYQIHFEQDVSGLALGADVRYLGVRVGSVTGIALSPDSTLEVNVVVDVDADTPVSTATFATLAMQGITGVAFISLEADPTIEGAPLAQAGDEPPLIASRKGSLARLLSSSGDITDQFSVVLQQMSDLFADDNVEAVGQTLESIASLTEALAEQSDALARLPGDAGATLREISEATAVLRQTVEALEPQLPELIASLDAAAGDLASITERMDRLSADREGEMSGFLRGGLGQMPALVAETRTLVREMQKLVGELRDDPSAVIYQPNSNDIEAPDR